MGNSCCCANSSVETKNEIKAQQGFGRLSSEIDARTLQGFDSTLRSGDQGPQEKENRLTSQEWDSQEASHDEQQDTVGDQNPEHVHQWQGEKSKLKDHFKFVRQQTINMFKGDEIDQGVGTIVDEFSQAAKGTMMQLMEASMKQLFLKKLAETEMKMAEEQQQELQSNLQLDQRDNADIYLQLQEQQLDELLLSVLPIIKLGTDKGSYLIGTESKQIIQKHDEFVLRIGGGFISLSEHIKKVAKYECLQILLKIEHEKKTFEEAMVDILQHHSATEEVVQKFLVDASENKVPFIQIMQAVRAKEDGAWERRKAAEKKEAKKHAKFSKVPNF